MREYASERRVCTCVLGREYIPAARLYVQVKRVSREPEMVGGMKALSWLG